MEKQRCLCYNIDMNTETDIKLTDIPTVPGRTASERLLMDINEETVYQNRHVDRYKGDKQQQFVELRARGAGFQDIADILVCGKSTLVNWNKEMADEIAERKAMTKTIYCMIIKLRAIIVYDILPNYTAT